MPSVGLAFALSAQETNDPAIEDQPISEQGDGKSSATGEEDTSKELQPAYDPRPAINGLEAAIRDLIAQQSAPDGKEEADRARRDLDAQEAMARWAKLMLFATAASVIVTGVGVMLIKWTLEETKAAAKHADNAARAGWETVRQDEAATLAAKENSIVAKAIGLKQTRPYLVYETAESHFVRDEPNMLKWLYFDAVFRNGGITPAIITAESIVCYCPGDSGGIRKKEAAFNPRRSISGPNQISLVSCQFQFGIEAMPPAYVHIGIQVQYKSLEEEAWSEVVWLTRVGSKITQEMPMPGCEIYEPEE